MLMWHRTSDRAALRERVVSMSAPLVTPDVDLIGTDLRQAIDVADISESSIPVVWPDASLDRYLNIFMLLSPNKSLVRIDVPNI